jgi:hypothetical protein
MKTNVFVLLYTRSNTSCTSKHFVNKILSINDDTSIIQNRENYHNWNFHDFGEFVLNFYQSKESLDCYVYYNVIKNQYPIFFPQVIEKRYFILVVENRVSIKDIRLFNLQNSLTKSLQSILYQSIFESDWENRIFKHKDILLLSFLLDSI